MEIFGEPDLVSMHLYGAVKDLATSRVDYSVYLVHYFFELGIGEVKGDEDGDRA